MVSACNPNDFAALVARLPQQPPFRFLDRIVDLSEETIVGQFTFSPELEFYKAHFPGRPITPGVILIEAMAQTGVVALGMHLIDIERQAGRLPLDRNYLSLFTECSAEFFCSILPGETVTIRGKRLLWRRLKLRSQVELYLANGTLAASATLAGSGVEDEPR